MGGALVGSSQAPQGIRRKVGRSFRGFAGARFHRQLAQWYGMVEMFFEQLIEGFSRVESGTSSALMNRVIGARWSPQSLAPRGEKPNHWLPPLTSIKATIPASRQASAWSTQIQPVSHWQLPHVGPTCWWGVIFVWRLIAANGTPGQAGAQNAREKWANVWSAVWP